MLNLPYLVLAAALVATAIIMACGWRQVSRENPPLICVYFGNRVELAEGYIRTLERRYFWGHVAGWLVVVVGPFDRSAPVVHRLSRQHRTFQVLETGELS
jgi:hypothetical protein